MDSCCNSEALNLVTTGGSPVDPDIKVRIETAFGLITEERVRDAELESIRALICEATTNVLDQDHSRKIAETIERADNRRLPAPARVPEAIRQIGKAVAEALVKIVEQAERD